MLFRSGEGCALNTFTYHINAQGLIAECGVSAGVNFTDSEGNVKYSIGAPYMHDSAGRFYGSVEYVLTEEYLGEYTLSVLVPDSLSSDDEIAYPVFIGFITDICGPDDVPASETICVSSAADTVDDGVPNPQAITVKAAPDAIGRKSGEEYVSYMEFADYPKLAEDDVFISSALALCQYINELPDENNSLVISACRTAEKCSSDNMTWELRPGAYGTPMCTKELSDASGAGAALRCDWNISDELRMYYDGDATQKTVLFSADATSSGLAVLLGSDAPLAYSPYITVNYYRNEAVSADDRDVDQKPAGDNADGGKFEEVASTVITVDDTDATDDGADSLTEASTQSSEFSYASYGITRSYRADNSLWKIIPNNSDIGHTDGVRILTTNKPYYFKYKARVTDNGWQAPVLSTDTEAYAGLTGHYITNLAIEVYEGGRRIYDNYVVMYRAKVAGEWLDWVSNGTPAVMQTIKEDFSLSGNLDINAIDAGW